MDLEEQPGAINPDYINVLTIQHDRKFARIKRTERTLSSTVSKQIVDVGEKANVVVGDKGNIDKETGKRKPRYASAHDLRREFGERWSLKVMPDVLTLLMRHSNIDTTMKYYVGRNAQKAVEVIWEAHREISLTPRTELERGR
ncbi:hypothetical protein V6x_51690 [Gimesia chilikensis]|uniref:Tyr recombinase domain-containing protein n=1 Tax=Gimesia chilikensis TaxID=2605989 RepID=A0A517WJJ6_9PLAN|nr:hypothetical protein V6x_51690 [Gimesia chilikensis]